MKRKNIILPILAVIAAILPGCVREKRDNCPCMLHIDLSRFPVEAGHVDIWTAGRSVLEPYGRILAEDFGEEIEIPVLRDTIQVFAWGGINESELFEPGRQIHHSSPYDSLWGFYSVVPTRCEDARVTVIPEREFCPLTIITDGLAALLSEIALSISGSSGGFLFDTSPFGGPMTLKPLLVESPSDNGECFIHRIPLPRQVAESELGLDLSFNAEGVEWSRRYPLSHILKESGVDICKPDQDAVTIHITIEEERVLISIRGWNYNDESQIII